jgi:hypothetical protein
MDINQLEARAGRIHLISQILAWCFVIPVFLYPLIVSSSSFAPERGPALDPLPQGALTLLVVVAILLLIGASRLSTLILASAKKKFSISANPQALLSSWLLSVIVGFAMREGSAIVGLALSLMTANPNFAVWLGLVAFISMARNWPRAVALRDFLQAARG